MEHIAWLLAVSFSLDCCIKMQRKWERKNYNLPKKNKKFWLDLRYYWVICMFLFYLFDIFLSSLEQAEILGIRCDKDKKKLISHEKH